MPTNQQRRDVERRRLQRQLEERRAKEVARRRFTLIASVVGTVVVIAGVVIAIVVTTSGSSTKKPAAAGAKPAFVGPSTVHFDGVTVTGATDLKKKPTITSKASAAPAKLEYKDLVGGSGKAAGPSSNVVVQYDGVLYKNGTEFDSSWKTGAPVPFSLQQVVPGFTQGIGGTTGVPPMKVGGRRLIIMPAKLGYGNDSSNAAIPPNSPLVFVVDLTKVS